MKWEFTVILICKVDLHRNIIGKLKKRNKYFTAQDNPESPEKVLSGPKLDLIKNIFTLSSIDRALRHDQNY